MSDETPPKMMHLFEPSIRAMFYNAGLKQYSYGEISTGGEIRRQEHKQPLGSANKAAVAFAKTGSYFETAPDAYPVSSRHYTGVVDTQEEAINAAKALKDSLVRLAASLKMKAHLELNSQPDGLTKALNSVAVRDIDTVHGLPLAGHRVTFPDFVSTSDRKRSRGTQWIFDIVHGARDDGTYGVTVIHHEKDHNAQVPMADTRKSRGKKKKSSSEEDE